MQKFLSNTHTHINRHMHARVCAPGKLASRECTCMNIEILVVYIFIHTDLGKSPEKENLPL